MIVKFFRYGTNVKGSVEYLLNQREQQGLAKTIKGNPTLTKEIIKNVKTQNKYKSGCLSFEEENITNEIKQELIKSFEDMLLAGFDKEQYNILWVEHIDKGRLELNFVIPRVELTSQKAFNPYYAKIDQTRVNNWKDLQNLKYKLSDPNDPTKKRTFSLNKNLQANKSYKQLDEMLHNLVSNGTIKNRDNLIELLKANSFEVPRVSKDYISIKMPNLKAKRFKGVIYNEQFTKFADVRRISEERSQEIREYDTRDTSKIITELERKLKNDISKKAIYNKKRYTKRVRQPRRSFKGYECQKPNKRTILYNSNCTWNDNGANDELRNKYNLLKKQRLDSSKITKDNIKPSKFYEDIAISNIYTSKFQLQIYKNRTIEYDTIRKSLIRRTEQITTTRAETIKQFENSRATIFQKLGETNQRVHNLIKSTYSKLTQPITIKFRDTFSKLTATIRQLSQTVENIRRKSFYIDEINFNND